MGVDPPGEILQVKHELLDGIKKAIDELSNLRSLNQLAKESDKAKEMSKNIEKRAKVQEYRLEQANLKMKKIEADDKERCRKTASILKEFEEQSGNGPFFESLLNILLNFQGELTRHSRHIKEVSIFFYFKIGGINTVRRTVKCMNETMSQLIDAVRTVQEDQIKISIVIDKLLTKVKIIPPT